MNFIQFLITFAGLVVGVSAVAILFWYLSKTLKKNVIVRNGNTFTIVHLKELDQYPDLLKNTDFKKMGNWTAHDNGREFRGTANVSKETLRQWIIDKYHLKLIKLLSLFLKNEGCFSSSSFLKSLSLFQKLLTSRFVGVLYTLQRKNQPFGWLFIYYSSFNLANS